MIVTLLKPEPAKQSFCYCINLLRTTIVEIHTQLFKLFVSDNDCFVRVIRPSQKFRIFKISVIGHQNNRFTFLLICKIRP